MMRQEPAEQALLDKIRSLPPEKVSEVEDFVDFLREREAERTLQQAVTRLAEPAFAKVWHNTDDAEYDDL